MASRTDTPYDRPESEMDLPNTPMPTGAQTLEPDMGEEGDVEEGGGVPYDGEVTEPLTQGGSKTPGSQSPNSQIRNKEGTDQNPIADDTQQNKGPSPADNSHL